jgi:hypothetical protein
LQPFASDCIHDRQLALDGSSQSFETLVVQRQVSELIRHHLTNVAGLSAFTSMVSAMLNNVCESL